jgi:cyclase
MVGEFYSRHFTLEKVREGIYAAIAKEGGGAVGNAGFIDLGDQTIVFDTFNTQQAAADLRTFALQLSRGPITWVVNSHWHGDHIRGNQVFKESTIISSQLTFEKIRELHPARIEKQKNDIEGLKKYIKSLKEQIKGKPDEETEKQIQFLSEMELSLPSLELVMPQRTFTDEFTIQGTKRSARLMTLGGGHSYCDTILYLPADQVVFMGDLLFVDSQPTIFEESNRENWVGILKKVGDMEIETAIPGHGPIGTKRDFHTVIEIIESNK